MADVFISYSRKDKAFVQVLHQALAESKYDAWIDWQDIPPTADWWAEIEAGIEAADAFLFVISPDSVASRVCNREVDHAVTNHKRLIPIVQRQGSEREQLHPALSKHNWLYFTEKDEFEPAFAKLVDALNIDLAHVKEHTRILLKAIEWEKRGRNDDLLLRGRELEAVFQWLADNAEKEPRSTQLQREYVNHSRKVAQSRQLKETNRQKSFQRKITFALIAAVVGLLVSATLGLIALRQRQMAEERKVNAEIISQSLRVKELFQSGQEMRALTLGLRNLNTVKNAHQKIRNDARLQAISALNQAVFNIHEHNQLKGHEDSVFSIAYSPNGEKLVSGSEDGSIRIWSSTGDLLDSYDGTFGYGARSIAVHPNEELFAFASFDGNVTLWNLSSKEKLTLKDNSRDLAFSPVEPLMASANANGPINLWDFDGNLVRVIGESSREGSTVAFSVDGKFLFSGDDNYIKIWDLNGNLIKELTGHKTKVISIDVSKDGQHILSSDTDGFIKVWDENHQLLNSIKAHEGRVNSIQFSPNSTDFISAGSDGCIKIWSLEGELKKDFQSNGGAVFAVQYSPDGKTLASAGTDDTITIWSLEPPIQQFVRSVEADGIGLDFSPWGETLVIANRDGQVQKLDISGKTSEIINSDSLTMSFALSNNGNMIALGHDDRSITLWTSEGQLIATLKGHSARVRDLSFDPGDELIASASDDYTVRIWNIEGEEINTLRHKYRVFGVGFSPDNQYIASADIGGIIKLWDKQGREIKSFNSHQGWALSVSFSPDSSKIVSGGSDDTIKVWNLNGEEIQSFSGHSGWVRSVRFSPVGDLIASASSDGTVKLWYLDGTEVQTFRGHKDGVNGVTFNKDGQLIASSSWDKTIRIWDLRSDLLQQQACAWMSEFLIVHPQELIDLEVCQNSALMSKAIPNLIRRGEILAKQGNSEQALYFFELVQDWGAQLDFDPFLRVKQFVLVGEAEKLAGEGNFEAAMAQFKEAQSISDSKLDFEPETVARQLSSNALVEEGLRLIQFGEMERAMESFTKAEQLNPDINILAIDWNNLCWKGSLQKHAQQVLGACERAVALAPGDGDIIDSRGLARALTGDIEGAVADFETFIDWTNNQEKKVQRQQWIEALEAGENPFTAEVLESLQ